MPFGTGGIGGRCESLSLSATRAYPRHEAEGFAVTGLDTDRARGVLIGMAVGDALGAPVEFESPQQIAGRREWLWFGLPGGGPFGWAPGEFTDDTQGWRSSWTAG